MVSFSRPEAQRRTPRGPRRIFARLLRGCMNSDAIRMAHSRLRDASVSFEELGRRYTEHNATDNPEGVAEAKRELERARSEWNDALESLHELAKRLFPRVPRLHQDVNFSDVLATFPPPAAGTNTGDDDDYVPGIPHAGDEHFQAILEVVGGSDLTFPQIVNAIMLLVGHSQAYVYSHFDVSPVLIMDYLMMIAMLNGRKGNVDILITLGADFSRALSCGDFRTALHALLGADTQPGVACDMLMHLSEHHEQMFQRARDSQDEGGYTGSMHAAENGNWGVLTTMFNLGADLFRTQYWDADDRGNHNGLDEEYLYSLSMLHNLSTNFNTFDPAEFERLVRNLFANEHHPTDNVANGRDSTDNVADEPVALDDRSDVVEGRNQQVDQDLVRATRTLLALLDDRDPPPGWMAHIVVRFRQEAVDAGII